jgi:hypothetical protein
MNMEQKARSVRRTVAAAEKRQIKADRKRVRQAEREKAKVQGAERSRSGQVEQYFKTGPIAVIAGKL